MGASTDQTPEAPSPRPASAGRRPPGQHGQRPRETEPRRRDLLAAAALGCPATLALVACGASGGGGSSVGRGAPPGGGAGGGGAGGAGAGGDAGAAPSATDGSGSAALARVADIPVGGAVSATGPGGRPLIVSQPSAGHVVAFSAICTHMGCTVAPQGHELRCPCHGSTYDLATGRNTGGPAPRPLTSVPVAVRGGEVVEA